MFQLNKAGAVLLGVVAGGLASAQTETNEVKLCGPYRITPGIRADRHIDLSGAWELSHIDQPIRSVEELKDRQDPFETQVPNSVQWSYCKAGKLPHPYAHTNSEQYEWIEEKVWYYQRPVFIPEAAAGKTAALCFDGIDYFSRVWVNGLLMGSHEGMSGGPSMDISSAIAVGKTNQVTVEVRAGNWGNIQGYDPKASGKIVKPWSIAGGASAEPFFSVGMWRGARIEILPDVHMERPYLTTEQIGENEAVLHLSLEILAGTTSFDSELHPWGRTAIRRSNLPGETFISAGDDFAVVVEFLQQGQVVFSQTFVPEIYEGRNWLGKTIEFPNPKLWCPVHSGAPELYQVHITLKQNGEVKDQLGFEYGIRTIEHVASEGPRTGDRWADWQFVINGEKIFLKGINWTPLDALLDLPRERYQWALEEVKNMGVQLIRVWGGGPFETDDFYEICNELGILVWQDFPIGNQDTPDYPQDVWEAQVVQNIFRLRNHPSLAVWCGGNEFNPYSLESAASMGIVERNLNIFDPSRLYLRTSPDEGSIHTYLDMDPCLFNSMFKFVPFVAESGIHSLPEAATFYEFVNPDEFSRLGEMSSTNFIVTHPEIAHHFVAFNAARVPRMLSRASHMDDLSNPTIEALTEATQAGAGEFYQLMSEKMQMNYPVTTGVMPWVFKRPWPTAAIQMVDWTGQAAAPYYFLKRTYAPTHVALDLPGLLWAPGDQIEFSMKTIHAEEGVLDGTLAVRVLDDLFQPLFEKSESVRIQSGFAAQAEDLGRFAIPETYQDRFLFVVADLGDTAGRIVSRSVYNLRVLQDMKTANFYDNGADLPTPWPTLGQGPWLRPTVAETRTELSAELISSLALSSDRVRLAVKVTNNGAVPSVMTKVDVAGVRRATYASDNYFWLEPKESKTITLDVLFRESSLNKSMMLTIGSWNVSPLRIVLPKGE